MKSKMKQIILTTSVSLGIATALYAQQHRREYMDCPIDGARMDWTGNQNGTGINASCEFSHLAFTADRRQVDHMAWASCYEAR
jgi:hypothetical protein